jgi:CHAT domain-containing protein/tetratricopeptide (TPR) repeat protein
MGAYGKALPLYERALEMYRQARGEGHPDYATALHNLAALHQAMGAYGKALPLLERALEVYRQAQGEGHPDYAKALHSLALLHQDMGAYGKALPLLERAREVIRKALGEAHPDYATSLNNLALLHREMGAYGKALPLLERAREVTRKARGEGHPAYANTLNNLAALYKDMGAYGKALPLLERALELTRQARGEGHPDYAAALNSLAVLHHDMGAYGKALPLLERALEVARKALGEDHPHYATALNNLAALYKDMGAYGKALPLLERALELRQKALGEGHPDYAMSLNNLALLHRDMGEYGKALPLYERALELTRKAQGEGHPGYAAILNNLAALHQAMGEPGQALAYSRQALALSRRWLDTSFAHLSEDQRGALLAEVRGNLDAFLSLADEARVEPAERYAAALLWKGAVSARQRDDRLLRDRPELRESYQQLQQARARLVHLSLQTPPPHRHAAWLGELAELGRAKDRLEGELARRSQQFRAAKDRLGLTPAAVADALSDDTALVDLLEYTHFSPPERGKGGAQRQLRLLAFVLRKGREPVCVPLGEAGPVRRAVGAWRAEVQRGPAGADRTKLARAAAELRRRAWLPLVRHLGGCQTVLLAPDGALCQLPFAALPGAREGTYLLEDYRIGYLASAHQLVDLGRDRDRPRRAPRGLLAVGGVDYGAGAAYGPLPGTGPEARRCRALFEKAFPGERADLLAGRGATAAEVQKACGDGYRYLHLATHGFFEPPDRVERLMKGILAQRDREQARTLYRDQTATLAGLPLLRCGLALAGANRPPDPADPDAPAGVLTGEAVTGLDLRGCELAVLSACQTALGDATAGDGVLGLQRAFHAAGARALAVSLWSVNDAATAVLMDEFYANLWDKNLSKLEALRQAQLAVLKDPDRVRRKGQELLAAARKAGVPEEQLRGPKGRLATELPDGGRVGPGGRRRSPEAWWAAFVLSGDTR